MATLAEITVMVPLHRSAPFGEIVASNLDRLAGHVPLIVSDADEHDATLPWLRDRFSDHPGITWLGRRAGAQGWVDHCNDLALRARTPLVMWLPHDDEIDLGYLVACAQALGGDPSLGAVVGAVSSVVGEGLANRSLPAFPTEDRVGSFIEPANAYLSDWNLGLLFRAVVRREAWRPLPHTVLADEWADMVWAYGLALEWPVRVVEDVVYRKRFHAGSAHAAWTTEFFPRALPFLMRELAARVPADRVAPAAIELVDVVTSWTADVVDERSRRAALLEERVDHLSRPLSRRLRESVRRSGRGPAPC